ncbi:MAG: lytic transglycosylase domain-containing protein [Hyphomicrobiales bacterium]
MTSIEDVSVNGYSASERVGNALKSAAQATGVDFDYLVKTAYRESSFRPGLSADTSSATGLFQFIEQTWLSTVKSDGAKFGLSSEANAIQKGSDGKYTVADPERRQQILDLRKDPVLSANLAGVLTQKNQAYLQQATGLEPTAGELYIAHFLGAKGAADLISAAQSNPTQKASDIFPQAAQANKALFYGKGGDSNTVQQVYANLISKHHDVGEPLPLRPEPDNILKSHAAETGQNSGETKVDGAQAAFLAGHFGSAATAFSAGLEGREAGFDALFGAKPKDGSSFFLPKSRYAAEGTGVADPIGGARAVQADSYQGTIPSRYGREDAAVVAEQAPATPSVFNQGSLTEFNDPVSPPISDSLKPQIITSSEFGKTDLPLDLVQYLKAYQKSE